MNTQNSSTPLYGLSRRAAIRSLLQVFGGALVAQRVSADTCGEIPLLEALAVLHEACSEARGCDFGKLAIIDNPRLKTQILAALKRKEEFNVVHVFYPDNESRLHGAFDWKTSKKTHLETLAYIGKASDSIVYILGQASTTGGVGSDLNLKLSIERMQNVLEFLRDTLQVPCAEFRWAYLGNERLQLSRADADMCDIKDYEYRGNVYVLNQAVRIFAVPCAAAIREVLDARKG